ncbi:dynein assembly factor 4, axonemal-like isoform X2 [Stegodyphus dumicola]|nr:dynein assembly factor 4, axonemal-like isoform X2 [Stegodyphus dumicola]XP_035230352.1 dynein assembly factor 4, axonemal-like isoform X2 [Stegodyphus dumicola]
MSVFRKPPDVLFSKVILTKGYGFNTPRDGSTCKIKVTADEMNLVTNLDDFHIKDIIIGDIDDYIDRVIEDCVRTMKIQEECRVIFQHPNFYNDSGSPIESSIKATYMKIENNEMVDSRNELNNLPENNTASKAKSEDNESKEKVVESSPSSSEEKQSNGCGVSTNQFHSVINQSISNNLVEIHLQLLAYTNEPEAWEMSVTEKWCRANHHKQKGLELYSHGASQHAFRRFGFALKYVISLEHDIPPEQEGDMDFKDLKLACYLNIAACQMRHHNYESVVINSTKALSIQPENVKALYRRGAAYVQLQEYEKADEDLSSAHRMEPNNQAVVKQIQILKHRVQKLNQYYANAMKKLFS